MRRFLTALALLCSLAAAPVHAQQTIKLTVAAGHPPAFLWVKMMDEFFIPEIDRRLAASGKYKIAWTKAYGGTLAKLGAESVAIKDGVADLGFVSTIFEASRFPLQNVSYYAPFGSDQILVVTRITGDLQRKVPAMADAWTKANLVYLGGAALDGYQIWSNFPIRSVDDIKGKKLSAPGPSANWIKGTGAVAVAGSLTTYYEDIKSGVSDGALTFATGAGAARLGEVAPYITLVNFGSMYAGGLAVNKKRFDGFPPEVQKAFRDAGAEYAIRFANEQTIRAVEVLKQMQAAGAKVYELPPAERKRWADTLPPIGKAWGAEMQSKGLPATDVLQGYMQLQREAGVNIVRDWAN
ncbi:MAG: C4-dicarboxylate TRAP transporter substrate-binding protein [Burkholderiales bacterium]|jgi:TRAP-type C4-dicarboxylate transport system substrate-binding protein|nr:C4-dicarboxylate TRAP transporter substrate-binding protein [Burkholderiales bacterium]